MRRRLEFLEGSSEGILGSWALRANMSKRLIRLKRFSPFKSLIYLGFKYMNKVYKPGQGFVRLGYRHIFRDTSHLLNVASTSSLFSRSHTSTDSTNTFRLTERIRSEDGPKLRVLKTSINSKLLMNQGIDWFKNKDGRFIGFSGIKSSFRESSRIPANIPFANYLSRMFKDHTLYDINVNSFIDKANQNTLYTRLYESTIGKHILEENLNYREVWSAGHDTYLPLITKCREASTTKLQAEEYIRIIRQSGDSFIRLPFVGRPPTSPTQIRVNPESNPGLFTSKMFGLKRKYSIHYTIRIAEVIMRSLWKSNLGYFNYWEPLGREKDIKVSKLEMGDRYLTRLCMHMEEPFMLVLSSILQPITDLVVRDTKNQIFLGKELTGRPGAEFFKDTYRTYTYAVELDWPNFDIHVTSEEMLAAVSLLRTCYVNEYDPLTNERTPETRYADHLFVLLAHSIIYKRVILNDGVVYQFRDILPSGLPGTSLIGSLINLLRWAVIGNKLFGMRYEHHMKVIVHGDDSLVLFKDVDNIAEKIKLISKTYMGHDIDDIVVYPWVPTSYEDLIPTFLKRKSMGGVTLMWDSRKVIRKLLYPSRIRYTFLEQLEIICNYLYTANGNSGFNNFLIEYLYYCLNHHYDKSFIGSYTRRRVTEIIDRYRDKTLFVSPSSSQAVPVKYLLSFEYRRFLTKKAPKYLDEEDILGLTLLYFSDNLYSALRRTFPKYFRGKVVSIFNPSFKKKVEDE